MAKSIQVFVNTGNEDNNQVHQFVQGGGDKGKPTRIKAVKGARYQLKDPALKDVGPEYIRSKRVGKNLHVSLDGSNEADLIIEGYYDEGYLAEDSTGLYGKAEDGQLYEYIPEDPTTAGLSANLVDGAVPVSQVLGGVPYGEVFALSALPLVGAALGGFAPLLVGAGLLGAAALAANRDNTTAAPSGQTGGLSSDSDTGSNNADGITNNKTPSYSGKAVAGSTVEVTINGKTYTTVADANGNYTVKIPAGDALPDGTYTPTIKVTNANGTTTSNGTPFTIDTSTTGTGGLTHDAANDTGSNPNDNITNNTKPTFSGTGEPGATVKLVVDGQTLTAVVGADGKWVASGPYTGNGLTGGQHAVVITFTDVAGNTSTVNAAPVFISTGVGNITLSVDAVTADNTISGTEASLNGNTDITGKASGEFKAGQIVTITINGKTFTGPVDVTGAYKISVPTADLLADPDKTIAASIAVTDAAGNAGIVSTTHPYLADNTPPNASTTTLTIESVTADNIIVSAENGPDATTNIKGKAFGEFQAGDKVTLTINGKTFFGTVLADGSYSIPVPVTDLAADPDTKIDATLDATDRTGNKGNIVAAHTYVVDTLGPDFRTTALVLDAVTDDNLISGTDTATSINIKGKASGEFKAGDKVSFTLNGTRYEGAVDAAGNFSIPVAKTDLTGNTPYIIKASLLATDANGNQGTVTHDHPYAVDTTGPSAATTSVTVNAVAADNIINATEAGQATIAIIGRVTGEFKAGDIVTLTVNKKPFTGRVDAAGNYTIAVTTADLIADTDKTIASSVVATDAAGNTGTVIGNTQTYLVDNTAPSSSGTTLIIDAVTDNDDNIINVAESQNTNTIVTGKVVGEFTAGDTVTLRIHNTDYTATVAANGTYSVSVLTNDLLADGDKTIAGSIVARDASGNTGTISATRPYIVDTVAPSSPSSAAINVNPVTADNLVNAAESNGRVDVTGLVTGEFQSGDVVTLVINNVSYTGTVNSSGVYSINVSGADLAADPDKTIAASVAARDTAGNVGTASNTHVYAVDTVSPNPAGTTLSVNVVTADNVINGDESLPTNTNVTGKATGVFRSGDTVTLTINGKDFTGTVDAAGDYTISVTTADLVADGDKTINAKIAATSSAGNVGTITTTHTYTVDITPPSATTTTLTVDVVTPDNIINTAESSLANIPVTGKAAGTFTAGDTVTLTINDKTFTGNVAADGSYSINVPAADLAADSDKTIAASIAAHDAAGNLGTVTSARAYAVDIVAPSNATTALTLDPITADNIINISESGVSTTTVTGKASGEFKAGDVVTLSLVVGGITKTVTTTVNAAGNFSVNVPTSDLVNDGDKTIVASLAATDAAGNVAAAGSITADQLYVVDTLAPANTALRIDAVTADDIINAAEAGLANLPITGKVTGEFTTGDTVTLTINGKPFTGSVDVNGNYSINVPTTDLRADPDLKIDGSILARDAAGNTGTFSATRPYLVDNTGPSNTTTALSVNVVATDDTINAAESGLASISVTGKVTGEFKSGDIVTLTVNGNTFTGPVDANGNYSINVATADLLADPDKTIAASIVATDAVGNTGTISAAHPYLVDTTPPSDGTTTISVNVVTPDNIINSSEATQTRTSVTGKVAGEFTAGDIVTITVNGNTATGTLDANGNYTVSVLTADLVAETGKTLTASVAARDPAGNIANVSTNHRYALDTTAPNGGAALGLTIDPDTNNDGTIGYTELPGTGSLNVTATFDKTKVAVGDIVTFTPVGGTAQTVALTQAMVDAGKVTVAFATPANGSTLDVTATLSDVAGNATVPARDTATINSTNPNATATIDIAAITTDSGTAGDFVTNDTTLTYSGTLTGFTLNGDKVKVELLDASGNVVETQTVTPTSATTWTFTPTAAQAAGNYTLRATIVDAAGTRVNATAPVNGTNGGQDTQLITIDTLAPTPVVNPEDPLNPPAGRASLVLDPITADNIITSAEGAQATVPVTGTARGDFTTGDTVTLTINNKTFTGTVASNGTFSINVPGADLLADSDAKVEASLAAHDRAGNVGTVTDDQTYTVSTTAPNGGRALGLTIDADTNNDRLVNFTEIGNTNGTANTVLSVSATFTPGLVKVGDIITFTDTATGVVQRVTLTQAMKDAGVASTTFTSPGDNGTLNVKATITDGTLGNTGPEATDSATFDLSNLNPVSPSTKLGVGIEIRSDNNNDSVLNTTEINSSTTDNVKVTLPTDAKAGDVLVITGTGNTTQSITLSAAQITAGFITTTFSMPANGNTLQVTARVTDAAGNTSNLATDSATVDTTPVGSPTVRIVEDTTNDGFINRGELGTATNLSVQTTLPRATSTTAGAAAGDTITVTDGTITRTHLLTQTDINNGFVTDVFDKPDEGGTINVSATLAKVSGNTSLPGTDSALLDTSSFVDPTDPTKSGLTVVINTDSNNDGNISTSELTTTFKATVTLPAQAAAGDTLTLRASGNNPRTIILTQAMINAHEVVVTDLTPTGDGSTFTVSASLVDRAGNATPTPDASDSAVINTSAPNCGVAPTVEITTDIDNSGIVNATELNGATTFTVKGSFNRANVVAGDQMVFSDGTTTNTVILTSTDIGNGFATTTFNKPATEGGTLTVSAALRDTVGNSTPSSLTDSATLDTTLPNGGVAPGVEITTDANNNGFVSSTELNGASTFAVKGTFSNGAVAGDKLVFTAGGVTNTVTLTTADIGVGFATTTFAKPATEGGTLTVTAVIEDAAGNRTPASASDAATLDTTLPNGGVAPGVEITTDANNNGFVSSTELNGASTFAVKGTFSNGAVAGDKLVFTAGGVTNTVTLTTADIGVGFATTTFAKPATEGGTLTVTAVIEDAAGNRTPASASDAATLDTTLPNGGAAVGLFIDLDTNNSNIGDGIISSAEKGSAIETSLTATFDRTLVAVGDKVTFSDGTTTKVVTLVQADITAGKVVSTDWALPNEGSTLNVTAVLTDAAGNATPQATDSAKLDTTAPNGGVAPTVSITTDADDNGKVGTSELNGATTFTVQGDFDNTLVFEGDKLVFTAGGVTQTVVLTAQNIRDGFATTTFTAPTNGNALTVNVLVQDAAGNQSPVSDNDTATLDTTTPTLTISHDKTVLLAGQNSTVTFTFSEEVAGFTLDDIDASDAQGSVTGLTQSTQDPKVWTATFTPTANINDTTNVIKVANDVYTDVAGNKGTGDDSDNFEIKTEVPSVTITLADPALKAGETSLVTYTFSQTPTGFEAGDVTISGAKGTLSDPVVTPGTDNKVWTATFTPTTDVEDTTNVISIAAGTYTNSTGVNGTEGTSANFTIDTKAPTLTIAMADSALVVGETSKVTFTFSEAPTGFTAADVTVPSGIGAISGLAATSNPLVWEALFTPATNVAYTANIISVAASTYTDAAGNNGGAAETANFTIDTTVPTVTVEMGKSALKGGETTTVTFTFSQTPTGFDVADVDMTGAKGALSNLVQDPNNSKVWTATFTPTAQIEDATNIIKVKAESYTNASGNKGTEGVSANFTIDTLPPSTTITIDTIDDNQGTTTGTVASGGVTDDTTPTVKGTLGTALATGETVHIFDNGVDIGTATISVGSTAFTFNDTRTSIVDGSNLKYTAKVFDAAGNSGTASNLYTATITTTVPTITVTSVALDTIDATHLNGLFDTSERAALIGSATLPIISGTTTNVDVGQTVSVTLNGHTYTGTVAGTKASGTWSISVTEADALLLNHGNTYDISATVSDAAGQTATDTDNKLEVKVGELDIPTVVDNKTNSHTPTLTGVSQKLVSGSPVALDTNDILEITIKNPDGTIAKAISATIGGTLPTGFTYTASTKTWSYDTAAAGLNLADGTYEIIVLATDAVPNPDVQKADISTSELIIDSTAPVFSSGASVDVAENIDISVAANAVVYTAAASDSTTGNHGATFSLKSGGDAAKFSIDATTGKVSIKESPNFEDAANTDHQYSFTVEAIDTFGNKSEKAVTVNVTNVNEAPVAVADTVDATEAGGTANGTAGTNPIGNALTNDTDVDANDTKTVKDIKASSAASVTAVNASTTSADGTEVTGSFGKLKIGADGSYVYTVDNTNATVQALNTSSTALQDVFSYTVKDAAGLTSTANITVSVKGANDAPTVATAIADTTGTVGTAFANFVLPANTFADVDDSTLTLSATLADGTALPSWLTFNASTRTFSATPNATPDTTGTVSVKVTATDGGSLTATDTFDIVVGAANAAPVANPTTVNNAFGPSQAPEVTITDNQSAAYVANGTELTYTLKFSKAINAASLTASDLKLTGQDTTFASVLTKVDDTTWTYTAKAAASGSTPMVLSMADATYTSTTGEQGLGGSDVQGVGTAPGPVPGTGTQVNTKNLGLMYSFDNAIETLSDGGWVATYYVSGVGGGTYAQRYNADGSTNGGEISVVPSTTATGGIGGAATVSALPNGGFVVASSDQNNTYYRIYDASNTASSTTPLKLTGKAGADVLALNDGTFVMTVTNASGAANGNFLYHFDSAGAQIGSAVPIDSAALPISSGWLTKLANGNFVYTWTATASGTGETQDIYMQLFDATGAKVGNFTRANTTVAGIQYEPSVADLENGGYVVSWRSGTTANSLVMRIFDASGNAVGNEITVASVSSGSKSVSNATVEGLVGGGFVVTYDNTSDSANFYVQVYDDAGATVGSPVKVADDPLNAARPVATALSNGGFVVEYRTKNAAGTVATYQTIFGPTGAVVATGTAAADTLTGNDKADTITGAGGADIIYAGSGDDKVILNTDNVTKLADAAAATMVVDGGTGVNTLQITNSAAGTGATLDLTSATVAAKLKGFSSIDITGPAATANTLKLDYKAISTLSGTTDNAATTAANESKMLVVSGDAGDTVELVDKASWNVGSSQSAASLTALYGKSYNFVTGHTYKAYTLNGATLFVDDAVTLNTLAASTGGAGTTAVAVTEAKTVQQLFGPSFSDTDSGQVFKGVAITSAGTSAQVSAAGAHYEWSADGGTTWTALAAGLTDSTAVFLEPTALIRFAAAAGSAVAVPTADLKAHLVDTSGLTNTTSLVSGNTTDASLNGGSTAFSDVPVVVSLLNRAPEVPVGQTSVVDPFGVGVISRTGTFVIDGSSATVTSGGQTVATIAVSSTSTALQSTDATRLYVPKGVSIGEKSTFVETDTFTFTNPQAEVVIKWAGFNINSIIGSFISIKVNGVDHVFSASDVVEVGQNGTATITTPLTPVFSTDGLKFIDVVEPTTNSVVAGTFRITPPAGSTGINTLEISVKDDAAGITATLSASQSISFMTPALSVATLFGGTHFGDADVLDKLKGVVITNAGAAADITGKGKYQFSTDNGTTWTDLAGGLTDATGVYLKSTDLVRFQSVGNTATAIKQNLVAHLVDTSTASSTFTTSGATVDVSGANSGGSTAVSSAAITIAGSTAPVVLDLNHDGVLAYSQVQMDVNGDGVLDQTAWAAAQDGVLVWDKYADGKVHNNSQYAFAQYGAAGSTDLQGLAAGFDSNADGVFNAQDAKFAQFAVWQDANQNGVADAGEVRKLSDVGVTAINLTSDGVVRVPNAQVVEAGHSTAQLTDGSTMVVADAEFGVQALSYHIDTTAPDATKLVLTGAGMDLNLSTFAAKHGAIAEVDVSGTGANSIKLTLADLLQGTPNATLKITGDADDSVNLDVAAWTNTGNTVAQNGHTYAVYNDVSSHTAQLLIDQNLVNAGHVI